MIKMILLSVFRILIVGDELHKKAFAKGRGISAITEQFSNMLITPSGKDADNQKRDWIKIHIIPSPKM